MCVRIWWLGAEPKLAGATGALKTSFPDWLECAEEAEVQGSELAHVWVVTEPSDDFARSPSISQNSYGKITLSMVPKATSLECYVVVTNILDNWTNWSCF